MDDIKIVVPSMGRANRVHTKRIVNDIIIVCPESEVDEYKKYNPELEIVGQPEGCKGITQTRAFILDMFDEVFMLDDDVKQVNRFFTDIGEKYKIENKLLVRDIIQQTANLARGMGAKMFGFDHNRSPVTYHANKPFRTTGYLNASHCGFLKGHGMSYDKSMIEGEDHYISCLNVYKNRFMLINDRYGFFTEANFKNDGGCSGSRNVEIMKENTLKLREYFGDCVHIKKATILKTKLNEGERSISFPY